MEGVASLLKDFGMEVEQALCADATAAIGIVRRAGLGKVRHLAVGDLWIQEKVGNKALGVRKIGTKENMADLMTKNLPHEQIVQHLSSMGMEFRGGRSASAPTLKTVAGTGSYSSADYRRVSFEESLGCGWSGPAPFALCSTP